MSPEKRDPQLVRAIKSAGGTAALCRFINQNSPKEERLTSQAISQWPRCPDRRVLIVELATADTADPVSRHELRPDLYPLDHNSLEQAVG